MSQVYLDLTNKQTKVLYIFWINDVKKEPNKFNKYLVFIDLKNAYDKVIHNKLFEKLG